MLSCRAGGTGATLLMPLGRDRRVPAGRGRTVHSAAADGRCNGQASTCVGPTTSMPAAAAPSADRISLPAAVSGGTCSPMQPALLQVSCAAAAGRPADPHEGTVSAGWALRGWRVWGWVGGGMAMPAATARVRKALHAHGWRQHTSAPRGLATGIADGCVMPIISLPCSNFFASAYKGGQLAQGRAAETAATLANTHCSTYTLQASRS